MQYTKFYRILTNTTQCDCLSVYEDRVKTKSVGVKAKHRFQWKSESMDVIIFTMVADHSVVKWTLAWHAHHFNPIVLCTYVHYPKNYSNHSCFKQKILVQISNPGPVITNSHSQTMNPLLFHKLCRLTTLKKS